MGKFSYMSNDAVGLASLVKKKEIKPQELVDAALKRLHEVNPELNAVIHVMEEKARQQAEQQLSGPLAGVPMLLKNISQAIAGEPLTSGAKLFQRHLAQSDSHFTAKLRDAGAIFLGFTNVPEFGLMAITEPELHGPTRNPWNLDYTPGGSSGGSAAAVAAGIVPVAGASDGGGSIRIPSAYCGCFGLKPTRGRTPVGPGVGRQWQGASIDFVISRTVRDSAAMLDVLQTVQQAAAYQTPLYEGKFLDVVQAPSTRKFRIAYTTESPVGTPVHEEAKQAVHKMVNWLEAEGHYVEEKNGPVDGHAVMHSYFTMNNGEISGMVASIEKMIGRSITADDVEIITWVLNVAGHNVSAKDFVLSLEQWDVAAAQMAVFHETYDFYVTPTNAFPPAKVGELMPNEEQRKHLLTISELSAAEQIEMINQMFEASLKRTPFTQLANLTGQPAMTVPTHVTKDGLPLGVQFVAPKGREDLLLTIAAHIEQADIWEGMKKNPMMKSASELV